MKKAITTFCLWCNGSGKYAALIFASLLLSGGVILASFREGMTSPVNNVSSEPKGLAALTRDTSLWLVHSSAIHDGNHVYLAWVTRNQKCPGVYVVEKYIPGSGEYRYTRFIRSETNNPAADVLYDYIDESPGAENMAYRIWFFGDNKTFMKGESFLVNSENIPKG